MRFRALIALALTAGLLGVQAPPARAGSEPVQTKRYSGLPHGKSGSVNRYADRSGDGAANSVTFVADDADGSGNRCTETWVDYSTKPHQHFNPGLLVNCSGGNRRLSGAMANDYRGIAGMQVVVCDVPDTDGPITRDGGTCRGNLKGMDLHSGQRYERFRVDANQFPSGVKIYRI